MKKAMLAGAMLALMAVAAQAQVTIDYTRRTRNSSLSITFSTGYYSYYGYGGFGGFGGPGGCGGFGGFGGGGGWAGRSGWSGYGLGGGFGYPGYVSYYPVGFGYNGGGSPLAGSFAGTPTDGAFYSGFGMYSYGTMPGLYGGAPYRSPYYRPPNSDYYPGPMPSGGAADRMPELASSKEIEVGRLRFKAGDYKGALDEFRSAVVSDTSSGGAQAHFAIALVVTGDGRNADKALRAAVDRGALGKIDFTGLFAGEKERLRVMTSLSKVSGDGALSAAYALSVMGDAGPLKKLAEKDAVAKKLAP